MHAAKFAAPRDPPRILGPAATDDEEMLAKVVAAIDRCLSKPPAGATIERVAAMAGMNVRTLQRRLESAGCSFRDLREREYRNSALAYLATGEMSIKEVSERLGYSDPAHFARAFRRWMGEPPTAYARRTCSSKG